MVYNKLREGSEVEKSRRIWDSKNFSFGSKIKNVWRIMIPKHIFQCLLFFFCFSCLCAYYVESRQFAFDSIATFDVTFFTGTQTSAYLVVFDFLSTFPRIIMRTYWLTRKITKEMPRRRFLLLWFRYTNYERAELQVLLQERNAFGTQPDKDCNEGKIVMQGENGTFGDRVANLSSFLVSFLLLLLLLLLLLRVQKSMSQQHVYHLRGHRRTNRRQ